MTYDEQYLEALKRVMIDGTRSTDRTGVGTKKVFDINFNVDLTPITKEDLFETQCQVIPTLTLRKVYPRTAFHELIWMLRGSTDATELQEKGISIWDGNTSREFLDKQGLYHIKEGHIGRGYGRQFRNFNGVDQLYQVVKSIQSNPASRRHFISLWNPSDLNDTALPPCHVAYNFMVEGDKLHLKFFQRSADLILGVPMNMMFAGFFLNMMATWLRLTPGNVAHSITDCHIYDSHKEAAQLLLFHRDPIDHRTTYCPMWGRMPIHLDVEDIDPQLCSLFGNGWKRIEETLDYRHNDPIPPEMLKMAV